MSAPEWLSSPSGAGGEIGSDVGASSSAWRPGRAGPPSRSPSGRAHGPRAPVRDERSCRYSRGPAPPSSEPEHDGAGVDLGWRSGSVLVATLGRCRRRWSSGLVSPTVWAPRTGPRSPSPSSCSSPPAAVILLAELSAPPDPGGVLIAAGILSRRCGTGDRRSRARDPTHELTPLHADRRLGRPRDLGREREAVRVPLARARTGSPAPRTRGRETGSATARRTSSSRATSASW